MNQDQEIEIRIEDEENEAFPFPSVEIPIKNTNVDQEIQNQEDGGKKGNIEKWKNMVEASKIFFGIDAECEQESNLPILTNKTLVNWNERTIKILKNKNIFGGKIKESAIKQFVENVDINMLDKGDTYRYFKLTNKIPQKNREENLSSFIGNRIAKAINVRKTCQIFKNKYF